MARGFCLASFGLVLLLAVSRLGGGFSTPVYAGDASAKTVNGAIAETGDLVEVEYSAYLNDSGELVRTTQASVDGDPNIKKAPVPWYSVGGGLFPVMCIAGEDAPFAGLANAIVGKKPGYKGSYTLTPEEGYGQPSPDKIRKAPRTMEQKRKVSMPLEQVRSMVEGEPAEGQVIDLPDVPYMKIKIMKLNEKAADVEFITEPGKEYRVSSGTVTTTVKDDAIVVRLDPTLGGGYPWGKRRVGYITGWDDDNLTVEINHPLAGKSLRVDYEIVSVEKAATIGDAELPWIDDYDLGLKTAREQNKPVVLVLHAAWCGWCKRLLAETMTDKRIKSLRDAFVWMKIDSDVNKKYREIYEQDGFPMIVFLNPDGTVNRKNSGYLPPDRLYTILKSLAAGG